MGGRRVLLGVSHIIAIQDAGRQERAVANRSDVLGELFDEHHDRLYRLARRLSRHAEDARDLVQETFLRVARRPDSLPQRSSEAEAWLVTVLVNLTRDRERRLSVRRRYALEEVPMATPMRPPDPESAAVARSTVQGALARLTSRRRAVVVLLDLEGLSVKRVAALLGVAPVTVRWHHAAGRRQLARLLETPETAEGKECHEKAISTASRG